MDYLNHLNLENLDCHQPAGQDRQEHQTVAEVDHSALAMRAAKRMRRSKHKEKTGHKVCHHLLEMIREASDAQPSPRAAQRYHGLKHHLAAGSQQICVQGSESSIGHWAPANDLQFSLSF